MSKILAFLGAGSSLSCGVLSTAAEGFGCGMRAVVSPGSEHVTHDSLVRSVGVLEVDLLEKRPEGDALE